MTKRFCGECGQEHPADAKFCMYCGYMLNGEPVEVGPNTAQGNTPAPATQDKGIDWGTIVAALLAFFSLRHMSRQARQATIFVVFIMMFFGCPMVCGFIAFVMEWFANLFQ
jgi:hypothetical protein